MKRTTEKAMKGYLENVCDEIVELQRTERFDLDYMKKKKLVWK